MAPTVWLSEGFATYFAALWIEHAHGDSAFRADLRGMRTRVLASPITIAEGRRRRSHWTICDVCSTRMSTIRLGSLLHMLRIEIGDSAFFNGIRAYYAQHRHGNATTAELQRAFEHAAGRPLDWFFDQWMRRPGVAELQPTWKYDGTRRKLVVTVVQGTRVPPYRLSLAVDVTDATGATKRVRLTVPATASSTIDVPMTLTSVPRSVVFDADVSLLGVVQPPKQGIVATCIVLRSYETLARCRRGTAGRQRSMLPRIRNGCHSKRFWSRTCGFKCRWVTRICTRCAWKVAPTSRTATSAEHAARGDVAVTADIPLAAILVPLGVIVIDPPRRGIPPQSRSANGSRCGISWKGCAAPASRPVVTPVTARPTSRPFANALDRALTRARRSK